MWNNGHQSQTRLERLQSFFSREQAKIIDYSMWELRKNPEASMIQALFLEMSMIIKAEIIQNDRVIYLKMQPKSETICYHWQKNMFYILDEYEMKVHKKWI